MTLRNVNELPPTVGVIPLCAICGGDLQGSTTRANGQLLCPGCTASVKQQVAGDLLSGSDLFTGFLGGFVGGVAGAAVWAAIELSTSFQVGWIAFGVGWLVGMGVKLGAGNKRGPQLQFVGALTSVIGIFFSHYFSYAHPRKTMLAAQGIDLGYFNGQLLREFTATLEQVLSPWDFLWVAFAVLAAWRVLSPPRVEWGR